MSIDLSQFHQIFFEESFEGLDVMESTLLELDCNAPESESINTIFRAAHSIKGSSGTFGFSDIADFTHVLETLLDQIRDGSRALTQEHVDLLLESVDCLRGMLSALQADESCDRSQADELIAKFNAILSSTGDPAEEGVDNGGQSTESAEPAEPAEPQILQSSSEWHIRFVPQEDMLRTGNDPARMLRELAQLGEMNVEVDLSKIPDLTAINSDSCYLSWDIHLSSSAPKEAIEEVFEWVEGEAEVQIDEVAGLFGMDEEAEGQDAQIEQANEQVQHVPVSASQPDTGSVPQTDKGATAGVTQPRQNAAAAKPAANSTKGRSSKAQEATSIRVSTDKVDSLVNLVGELVITQSMLGQLGTEFDISKLAKLQEGLAQLEHNTRELQESVMRIRMLPISFTFSRFPRMVRDLSRQLGKKVEIKLMGEQTELDKTVMEKIGDPLVHLVRNSLDHGLEPPEERVAAGKDETGTVTLNAYHQGGSIMIEIIDDGRGLNREKILAKAIENGLVQASEPLTDEQVHDLIFHPGFSTADQITDVSGRGVGMDVVRRNIQELNGTIEVESEAGKGSKFTIRLPLTLAILDGQLISVGDETYIIPLVSIVESLQTDVRLINHVAGGCDVFRLRDEYIPIIKLWEVFDIEPRTRDMSESLLVVLEAGNEKVALVVDDLLGQQQVVIKSMESNYHKVDGISGATILGDGTVSLILDITDLIRMAGVQYQNRKVVTGKFGGPRAA